MGEPASRFFLMILPTANLQPSVSGDSGKALSGTVTVRRQLFIPLVQDFLRQTSSADFHCLSGDGFPSWKSAFLVR